jgi:hypothetical protein
MVFVIAAAIYSWKVEILTSKEVPQRLIYQPRLQNRRLRVQDLVPLPRLGIYKFLL